MSEAPIPQSRVSAATVAMIHECRRLKCAPGKVGSAGQWGLIAKAGIDAADSFSPLAAADSPEAEIARLRTALADAFAWWTGELDDSSHDRVWKAVEAALAESLPTPDAK